MIDRDEWRKRWEAFFERLEQRRREQCGNSEQLSSCSEKPNTSGKRRQD